MIVWDTLIHRWYAFAFIPVFFWAAVPERGWLRALRFLAVASVVSFAAEYSSTHNGFPYGRYAYISNAHEAHIANVPLFVPLTFGIVVWAGRAVARARTTSRAGTIVGGALAAMAVDLVIDPITLHGKEWFLGPLYAYAERGPWFRVPLSNFAGWFLVSAVIIAIDLALDRGPERTTKRGVLLVGAIGAFFVVIGIAAHHERIPFTGACITAVLLLVALNPRLGPKRPRT